MEAKTRIIKKKKPLSSLSTVGRNRIQCIANLLEHFDYNILELSILFETSTLGMNNLLKDTTLYNSDSDMISVKSESTVLRLEEVSRQRELWIQSLDKADDVHLQDFGLIKRPEPLNIADFEFSLVSYFYRIGIKHCELTKVYKHDPYKLTVIDYLYYIQKKKPSAFVYLENEVTDYLLNGESIRTIIELTGISEREIVRRRDKLNLVYINNAKLPPFRFKAKNRREQIYKLYVGADNTKPSNFLEIAKMLGISRHTVYSDFQYFSEKEANPVQLQEINIARKYHDDNRKIKVIESKKAKKKS